MKINSNLFNFNFFLSDKKKVDSLEQGAKENGGATRFKDAIYSNYSKDEYIRVNNTNNTISILIPSTIDVNNSIDNEEYVIKYNSIIKNNYNSSDTIYYNTKGSWYSEDLDAVIVEDITIISLNLKKVTIKDILFFKNLALQVKKDMKQEGVSIIINDALCIA
jgi:hypothetical protein